MDNSSNFLTATSKETNITFNPHFWTLVKNFIFHRSYLLLIPLSVLTTFLFFKFDTAANKNSLSGPLSPDQVSVGILAFPIIVLTIWIGILIFKDHFQRETLRKDFPNKKALLKYLWFGILATGLISAGWFFLYGIGTLEGIALIKGHRLFGPDPIVFGGTIYVASLAAISGILAQYLRPWLALICSVIIVYLIWFTLGLILSKLPPSMPVLGCLCLTFLSLPIIAFIGETTAKATRSGLEK